MKNYYFILKIKKVKNKLSWKRSYRLSFKTYV